MFRIGPAEVPGGAPLTGFNLYPTLGSKPMVNWILTGMPTHHGEDLLAKRDNLCPLANLNLKADSAHLLIRLK